jgi:hypothetical protein
MDKQQRIEEIDRKCRMAGCSEARAKKHFQLFVYERWGPHPPDEFYSWHKENGQGGNMITAWNSDRERQEFYKSKGATA